MLNLSTASDAMARTADTLLGGRVRFSQPAVGYRVAIDPVLLAAAVPARAGDKLLELGSGAGAAALCLARRVPDCRIAGLEIDPEMVVLARANGRGNGLSERVEFVAGDVLAPPPEIAAGGFDHVFANPPHLPAAAADAPPHPGKAAAVVEGAADLAAWLEAMLALVRRKGRLTLIHRADRLGEVLARLDGRAGDTVVYPLWPGRGKPAKRVVVSARRGVGGSFRLAAGLVLHADDGQFTPQADAVLRDAAAIDL